MDDTSSRLAQRIRLEREARGWSLAELAEQSGVGKSTISKVERQEASPTATVLVRIAAAFELSLATLLLRAEGGQAGRLSRREDQPEWRDPDTGYVRRQIFLHPEHPVEAVEVCMPPGQQVRLPASSYAHIRQVLWVMQGELHLTEGQSTHCLHAGDALGFGAPADVVFANHGDCECRYLVMLARS